MVAHVVADVAEGRTVLVLVLSSSCNQKNHRNERHQSSCMTHPIFNGSSRSTTGACGSHHDAHNAENDGGNCGCDDDDDSNFDDKLPPPATALHAPPLSPHLLLLLLRLQAWSSDPADTATHGTAARSQTCSHMSNVTFYKSHTTRHADVPIACSALSVYCAFEGHKTCIASCPIAQMHAQMPGNSRDACVQRDGAMSLRT